VRRDLVEPAGRRLTREAMSSCAPSQGPRRPSERRDRSADPHTGGRIRPTRRCERSFAPQLISFRVREVARPLARDARPRAIGRVARSAAFARRPHPSGAS
jgi:hypothetical protein